MLWGVEKNTTGIPPRPRLQHGIVHTEAQSECRAVVAASQGRREKCVNVLLVLSTFLLRCPVVYVSCTDISLVCCSLCACVCIHSVHKYECALFL